LDSMDSDEEQKLLPRPQDRASTTGVARLLPEVGHGRADDLNGRRTRCRPHCPCIRHRVGIRPWISAQIPQPRSGKPEPRAPTQMITYRAALVRQDAGRARSMTDSNVRWHGATGPARPP
jgi:hypothetical protein